MGRIDTYAKVLWDYLQLHEAPKKSDIIFCLCSHDTRVAERAAQLMLDGLGEYLVFSGGVGKLTQGMFDRSEAEIFADTAKEMGVPSERIIAETKSTNTGENVRFTYDLLKEMNIRANSLLLVQKPYMERRTYATFKKQWPEHEAEIHVTSPQTSYEEYMSSGVISKERILNVMVGDMQRIREYPKLGFQIEQEIPREVWQAYEELVRLGFNKHLLS
ncbi:MAG TPA: YdcF family protein [Candidatus Saccharimonadales bacterium]